MTRPEIGSGPRPVPTQGVPVYRAAPPQPPPPPQVPLEDTSLHSLPHTLAGPKFLLAVSGLALFCVAVGGLLGYLSTL